MRTRKAKIGYNHRKGCFKGGTKNTHDKRFPEKPGLKTSTRKVFPNKPGLKSNTEQGVLSRIYCRYCRISLGAGFSIQLYTAVARR